MSRIDLPSTIGVITFSGNRWEPNLACIIIPKLICSGTRLKNVRNQGPDFRNLSGLFFVHSLLKLFEKHGLIYDNVDGRASMQY